MKDGIGKKYNSNLRHDDREVEHAHGQACTGARSDVRSTSFGTGTSKSLLYSPRRYVACLLLKIVAGESEGYTCAVRQRYQQHNHKPTTKQQPTTKSRSVKS